MNLKFRDLIRAPLSNLYAMKELELTLSYLKLSENDKVMEIGCGNGLGSIIASKIANEVVGIDISIPTIALLKEMLKQMNVETKKLDFVVADATKDVPVEWRGYFDKVFCIDVMEHVNPDSRENLLDFACKVLSPGGVLVMTFPINNYHHGHLITVEDVSNFILKIKQNNFDASSFYFKSSFISSLTDKIYTTVQNLFYSEPVVDVFEESVNFQLLKNPKWYHKLIKIGTILIFKFTGVLSPLYIESQPRSSTRALILGRKAR